MIETDSKSDNSNQEVNKNNYVSIVSEDCTRSNRIYNIPQSAEFMVDQFRIDNGNSEEGNGNQNTLYSVSQHVPNVNTSYVNLCQNGNNVEGAYGGSVSAEWDRERTVSCSDTTKDTGSETLSTDKQLTGNLQVFYLKNYQITSSVKRISYKTKFLFLNFIFEKS